MVIFGPSAAGALVKLRCPKCGTVQARARGPEGTTYACRECHASFTRETGAAAEEPPRRKR
jgi:transposase-like protein